MAQARRPVATQRGPTITFSAGRALRAVCPAAHGPAWDASITGRVSRRGEPPSSASSPRKANHKAELRVAFGSAERQCGDAGAGAQQLVIGSEELSGAEVHWCQSAL